MSALPLTFFLLFFCFFFLDSESPDTVRSNGTARKDSDFSALYTRHGESALPFGSQKASCQHTNVCIYVFPKDLASLFSSVMQLETPLVMERKRKGEEKGGEGEIKKKGRERREE